MALSDRAPSGLLRLVLRAPIALYRLRLGRLLGGRFLLLRHRGRKSGEWRENVLEIVGRDAAHGAAHDATHGAYYVAAAWGRRSQWLRNIEADPRVRIQVGRRRYDALARVLPREDGERVLAAYASKHRWAARLLAREFGFESMDAMAKETPVVELGVASD